MALSIPHASVEAPALSKPYSPLVASGNRLAAPTPVTWPLPRVAPRAELAAGLETAATLGLRGSAAMVFTVLWTWANAGGVAWPCVASIARRAGKSERTVFTALAALEEAGLVVRQRPSLHARRRFRESNTYRIAQPAGQPALSFPLPRAESPCPPRRVAPPRAVTGHTHAVTPVTGAVTPSPEAPVVVAPSPSPEAPVVVAPSPSPEAPVVAPMPAAAGPKGERHQLQISQTKGPGEPDRKDARADAQVRAATAPPVDRLGSPTVTLSPPEATHAPRLTRAERSARNRAAWAARSRSSSSAARVPPPPRRAPGYQAREHQAPDPAPALAALREWRESHGPALGREPDPASAPPAPVLDTPRSELGRWHPLALGGLLGAFAGVPFGMHGGRDERPAIVRWPESKPDTRASNIRRPPINKDK